MGDDRFKRLFTDKEFQIDQQNEAYQKSKPSGAKRIKADDVDSVVGSDDEEAPVSSGKDLNKLFSGRGEQSSSEGEASEDDDQDF